jgi:hypothetical protein
MTLIRSRVRDIVYSYLDPHAKTQFSSLTRRKGNRKRSGGDLPAPVAKLPRFSRTDEEASAVLPNHGMALDDMPAGAKLLESLSTVSGLTAVDVIGSSASAPSDRCGPFVGPVLPWNMYNGNLEARFEPSGCRMMDFGELQRYSPVLHVKRKSVNVQVHESTSYFFWGCLPGDVQPP